MKIIELEVKDVRGIRDLTLKPDGKNMAIWGFNGSGKSAVVDALDFLLTGEITRLKGKGTGQISIKEHGKHIDCEKPEEAFVRAIVKLPKSNNSIEILRRLDGTKEFGELSEEQAKELSNSLELADRGQHVLTRREILKFVTAEGKTRSLEIQELLNISNIEKIRTNLVSIRNTYKTAFNDSVRILEQSKQDVLTTTISITTFDKEKLLKFINSKRKILNADPIKEFKLTNLKKDIISPALSIKNNQTNPDILKKDIVSLIECSNDVVLTNLEAKFQELKKVINKILKDPKNLQKFQTKKLVDLGILLLEKNNICPLCDIDWKTDDLITYLEKKQLRLNDVIKNKNKIKDICTGILVAFQKKISFQKKIISEAIKLKGESKDVQTIKEWQIKCEQLVVRIDDLAKGEVNIDTKLPDLKDYFINTDLEKALNKIVFLVSKSITKPTNEQTAWDILTRLEENLKVYKRSFIENNKKKLHFHRATNLLTNFIQSKDKILSGLYEDVCGKFENLYRELHGDDESAFKAKIEPTGTGLNLDVDFYGRGLHPPHALHSEGHQDSMGLCLYLALADKLTKGYLDLIILDDVVMSVDIEHRKQLCSVLKNNFPNRQFIITTHDQTWAQMLRSEQVVNRKQLKEFFNWSVETGPNVNEYQDMWEIIELDLTNNDISGASAKLRRGSEQFFYEVCEKLQAQIVFKSGGQWDLGQLSNAAISQYKSLLRKVIESANSWDKRELIAEVKKIEKEFGKKVNSVNIERWLINPTVHYNEWITLKPNEFRTVLDAFRELFNQFICKQNACTSTLFVTNLGLTINTLRCKCGNTNWTLNKK